MITAVDTNVLLDIFGADPLFGHRSAGLLKQCLAEGAVYACDVVWAETATAFSTLRQFEEAMVTLGLEFSPLMKPAALVAAQAWRRFRSKGGKRDRVVADFLIGAHAAEQCDRLLTRDRGFYRTYFDRLIIADPSAVR